MEKLHELTERLVAFWNRKDIAKYTTHEDSIIRKWLEEKAKAIKVRWDSGELNEYLHDILGLTDEGEKKTIMICSQHLTEDCELCGSSKKTPQKQSWCEHTNINKNNAIECFKDSMHWYAADKWQFCPICGTPRPTPKPLVQRLAEKLNEPLLTPYGQAQIAIDFLREHKEEL